MTTNAATTMTAQITHTLDTGMPAMLRAISLTGIHGDRVALATEVLYSSIRVIASATAVQESGHVDVMTADQWCDRASRMAVDAAGRCGMDIDDLEELAGVA